MLHESPQLMRRFYQEVSQYAWSSLTKWYNGHRNHNDCELCVYLYMSMYLICAFSYIPRLACFLRAFSCIPVFIFLIGLYSTVFRLKLMYWYHFVD
jgi:hypothetical protein